jgi:signal transduction histidine kinase
MPVELSASLTELTRAIDDLTAISASLNVGLGADTAQIADSAAALLTAIPETEFIYVLVRCGGEARVRIARSGRLPHGDEGMLIGYGIADWLDEPPADVVSVKNPLADGDVRVLFATIGDGGHGVIALGSVRAEFPTDMERLLAGMAANQVAAGLGLRRSAHILHQFGQTLEQRIAAEIAARLQAFHQTEKMEAIGQLTGGIAHDFNNLLTAIWGSLELLERQVTTARERRLLRIASRAAHRGAELTGNLLAFSRMQHLLPEAVNLNRLVTDGRKMIERTIGSNVKIEMALAPDLQPAKVDPAKLELAIQNLAVNARDAMPEGGRLSIKTRNAAIPEEGSPPDLMPGEYVAISIADTGTGIEPELVDRVVEPFFTTKSAGNGSGLGLSMVHGLVKQSGGSLRIATKRGAGTLIELFLPRAE